MRTRQLNKCFSGFALWLFVAGTTTLLGQAKSQAKIEAKPAGSTLRIVNDNLVKGNLPGSRFVGTGFAVKGSIYNPNDVGVKNVVISYLIWKKFMGKEGHGSVVKETGGLVVARIKYIPPKQTVDFLAEGDAPRYIHVEPDPINVETVTADWED